MNLKTYLTAEEYEEVKGINLAQEIGGSSDHPENDAKMFIYRVESDLIAYLTTNYDFTESDIETNERTLNGFKLAVCDQVEYYIEKGITSIGENVGPGANENSNPSNIAMISPNAKFKLRTLGFMNIRSY